MKQLNLYKIKGKDDKEILCLSVKNLLAHLRELDVLAMRDDKQILATLIGECSEAIGEIKIEPAIQTRSREEREVREPAPMQKQSKRLPEPEVDLSNVPRPIPKKRPSLPPPEYDDDDSDEEKEDIIPSDDEEAEGDDEEFKLR